MGTKLGTLREPEGRQVPFRDLPMWQRGVRSGRPTDCDGDAIAPVRRRSRTPVRATARRGTLSRSIRRDTNSFSGQGSRPMRERVRITWPNTAHASVSDTSRRRDMLQCADVPRLHQRALAYDVSEILSGSSATGDACHDEGSARGTELPADIPNISRHSGKLIWIVNRHLDGDGLFTHQKLFGERQGAGDIDFK